MEESGKGTWKHAAFHVATTIATPAAYAPLPFALASLGWPLGQLLASFLSQTLFIYLLIVDHHHSCKQYYVQINIKSYCY